MPISFAELSGFYGENYLRPIRIEGNLSIYILKLALNCAGRNAGKGYL